MKLYRVLCVMVLGMVGFTAGDSWSQATSPSSKPVASPKAKIPENSAKNSAAKKEGSKEDKKEAAPAPSLPGDGQTPWQPLPQKYFAKEKRAAECAKYEGKYISSYDNLFWVQRCRRRPVTNGDLIRKITLTHTVYPVNNDTIIMLAEGVPLETLTEKELSGAALCKRLEGEYITIPGGDIYLVEGCKRRMFPDWETFVDHQKKTKRMVITEISSGEMDSLKLGKEIPSIMPGVFKKLLSGSAQVDVIPLNEACRGVNGKLVFYYSHIYKIENCRKREINAEEYMKLHKYDRFKLPELTSEQWLSLPDGKNLAIKDTQGPPLIVEPGRENEKEPANADQSDENDEDEDVASP